MKALILGVGRMGTAIAYAMDKLGFHVVGMDTNPEAAENMPKKINYEQTQDEEGNNTVGGPRNEFFIVDGAEDICKGIEGQEKPDIVISSLPYHQTEIVGKYCIDNGIRYCDLGGRVDVSQNINDHAKEYASLPIFTDLGLAPGLVNILAEWGYSKVHSEVDEIKMMVGGLPAVKTNPPLNYAVTWSIDGLINEYKDDCVILEDGEIISVEGMDGREKVSFELMGNEALEAFYTSGGASHTIKTMKDRGVKNCSYKTIRYDGHRDIVRFLIRNAELCGECLESIFKNGCPDSYGDIVLVKAQVKSGDILWNKEIIIGYDKKFSAMQKATAFSIASVAAIMASGKLDGKNAQHRDYWTEYPKALTYADVPFEEFKNNLEKLEIRI